MPITQNKWALNPGVTNKINWKFKLFQHLGMMRPWLGVQPLPWPGDWSLTMSSSAERNTQIWRRESQRWAAYSLYHKHQPSSSSSFSQSKNCFVFQGCPTPARRYPGSWRKAWTEEKLTRRKMPQLQQASHMRRAMGLTGREEGSTFRYVRVSNIFILV